MKLGSKSILLIGFLLSALYVSGVVYFNREMNKDYQEKQEMRNGVNKNIKFLLHLKNNHVDIITQLPIEENSSLITGLITKIDTLCKSRTCQKDIVFNKNIENNNKIIKLLEKYLKYIIDNNLSRAAIIFNNNNFEINYLVKNKEDLNSLSKLSQNLTDKINVVNSSSVVEVYDIESFQNEINTILNKNNISFENNSLTKKSMETLDKIFNKLKILGNLKLILEINLNDIQAKKLRQYVLKNYLFIKDIKILKNKKNKIEIKEIL